MSRPWVLRVLRVLQIRSQMSPRRGPRGPSRPSMARAESGLEGLLVEAGAEGAPLAEAGAYLPASSGSFSLRTSPLVF